MCDDAGALDCLSDVYIENKIYWPKTSHDPKNTERVFCTILHQVKHQFSERERG